MSLSILILLPLLVLGLGLLFPFFGCVGEDAILQAKEEGKTEGKAEGKTEGAAEQADKQKQQAEAAKYETVVVGESDLISYWRLSEGETGNTIAKDSAPDMPKDGEYKNVGGGGVDRTVPGILALVSNTGDKAAHFDGVKGYVEVNHDDLLNPPQEFSIEAWIRPDSSPPPQQVVVGSYEVDASGNPVRGFVLDIYTDPVKGPRARIRVGNGTGFTSLDASLESGAEHDAWRHLVATYDVTNKTLMLYVNSDSGIPDAPVPSAGLPAPVFYVNNESSPFRIGAGQVEGPAPSPAPSLFFAGRIDEVALYRKPLLGTKVKDHFQRAIAYKPNA